MSEEALTDDPKKVKLLLYVLEKREMEARLHEIVLSFYRLHQRLPVTVTQFLGLLASSRIFGEVVRINLEAMEVPFDNTYGEYDGRIDMAAIEIEAAHFAMRYETQGRYIVEVLPVMYGNLLKYYGDHDASQALLAGISRPNLYDELYACEPARLP